MSDALRTQLEGFLCHLGVVMVLLHSSLAQYSSPPLAVLKASQSKELRILYPMTLLVGSFSTARRDGGRNGWLVG
jgi:hypothetical protein